MATSSRSLGARSLALLALGTGLLASGCRDSVVCVFTTGCRGGGTGPFGEEPAGTPVDGLVVLDLPPSVVEAFPDVQNAHPETPLVVVFSESMNASSVQAGFELVPVIGGIPSVPMPIAGQLVAEGRVLVLLPATDLDPGEYLLQVGQVGVPADVTGQALDEGPGTVVLDFVVTATPPEEPRLLTTFPPSGAASVSELGDVVAVFDRPIDPSTVDETSFVVLEDGTPLPMPEIGPLALTPPLPAENRVFVYESGELLGFELGATIDVTLSPAMAPILELPPDGEPADAVVETDVTFAVNEVGAPTAAVIQSDPADAIGTVNLTAGNANELLISVPLANGRTGDLVDVFVFGDTPDQTLRIAVRGTVEQLADAVPATFTLADVPILAGSSPQDLRFAEGPLDLAFRSRRGGQVSPLRVLDVDLSTPLVTDPVTLDVTGPTVTELTLPGGATDLYRSDVRGIVIAGSADEAVRAALVSTPLGTNELVVGEAPAVLGSSGVRFLAAPVEAGVVPGGTTTFTLTVFDAALNPSAPISGTFEQLGAVDGGSGSGLLEVEVFDVETLQPVAGAFAVVHTDAGNGMDYPLFSMGQTAADGTVSVPFDPGAAAVILTVVEDDHDLFTLHGTPNFRISVPLQRTRAVRTADATGSISSQDIPTSGLLPTLDRRVADARLLLEEERAIGTATCMPGFPLTCSFGPAAIRAGALGAQAVFAGNFGLTGSEGSSTFTSQLVQVFDVSLPLDPALAGQTLVNQIEIEGRVVDAPMSEQPVELALLDFDASTATRVDLGDLDDDPDTTGEPRVALEVNVPGVRGPLTVGAGIALDQTGGVWRVRSAYPGILDDPGFLGAGATGRDIDDFLCVRFQVRDSLGDESTRRARPDALPPLDLLGVPDLVRPAGPGTGPIPFTFELSNEIPGALQGLYRVEVEDVNGRRWTLWRLDPPSITPVELRVPDTGFVTLADGPLDVRVAAFESTSANFSTFLWTDVELLYDRFSLSQEHGLTLP